MKKKMEQRFAHLKEVFTQRFTVTLLGLSLLSTGVFVASPTTVIDLLTFNTADIFTVENLVLLTLPLPFAFVTIHSLNGFRWESFAAFAALLLVPLGGKLALTGLAIAFGCPFTSWMAKNVYNQKNLFYTLYKATSAAVIVVALLSASLFVYAYTEEERLQQGFAQSVSNKSIGLAKEALPGTGSGGDQNLSLSNKEQEKLITQFVQITELTVTQHMEEEGNFTRDEYRIVSNGFNKAETRLLNQSQQQAAELQEQVAGAPEKSVRSLVNQQVRNIMEPGPGTNVAMFFIAFSLVMIVKLPFGLLGAIYAAVMLRLHPTAPQLPENKEDT